MAIKIWIHAKVDGDQFARAMAIPELQDAPFDFEFKVSYRSTEVSICSMTELRDFLETMRPKGKPDPTGEQHGK